MPKQLTRGQAARTVTLPVPLEKFHCRDLNDLLSSADDTDRLRGSRQRQTIQLHAQAGPDPVIKRIFSREEIYAERLAVRTALVRVAVNLTPERLRRLGSPGRVAVLALHHAASLAFDCDIRAGRIRSAAALLAGGRKKRTFRDSPAKPRAASLAKPGANALASNDAVRRVQLRRFCGDAGALSSLPALLMKAGDELESIAASMSIFRAAALGFILEDIKRGPRDPQQTMAGLRQSADSALLRLFIARWRFARSEGRIGSSTFPWFDAVDWLVSGLRSAGQPGPGGTRPPRSPRAVPAVAAAPRRAATEAPGTPRPARRMRTRTATPADDAPVPRLPAVAGVPSRPGPLQAVRQGVSRRLVNNLQSPTRLAGARTQQPAVVRAVTQETAPASPARGGTLLDIVLQEYAASLASATSTGTEGGSQTGTKAGSHLADNKS